MTAVPSRGSKRSAGAGGMGNPPAAVRITSPYDLEARYGSTCDTHWVGYTLHLTEPCDPGQPDLITQVITTPATMSDCVMGPTIAHDLAARELLTGPTCSIVATWMPTASPRRSANTRSM
jgi:hypothetical protein